MHWLWHGHSVLVSVLYACARRVHCADTLHDPLATLKHALDTSHHGSSTHPGSLTGSHRAPHQQDRRPGPHPAASASANGSAPERQRPSLELAIAVQRRPGPPALRGMRAAAGNPMPSHEGPEPSGPDSWLRLAGIPSMSGTLISAPGLCGA